MPEAYTIELAALRDDVRPFPFRQVETILAEEYRRPLSEVFRTLEPEPVASASISQVHRAVLRDGRTVALKIRRPDITKVVQADLDILKNLAQLAERRLPFLAPYKPLSLAREFERSLKRELDFTIERRTMQRCRQPVRRRSHGTHPVHDRRVLHAPRDRHGIHRGRAGRRPRGHPRAWASIPPTVALTGARILLKQIFQFGFFHADPHPGNLRVLPGGVIAPLDYGMFGQLDGTDRRTDRRPPGRPDRPGARPGAPRLDALDVRGDHVDPRALRRDVSELVHTYSQLTLDHINLGLLLRELIAFIRTHQLHIPPDLVLLIRSLVTIESVGRNLDPHFDIARQLEPFLRELTLRRFHPYRLLGQTTQTIDDLQRIATLLPDLLSQSLDSIKRGELNVRFDLQGFERLVRQLTRASNTLAIGIVISGLLVASSLVFRVGATSLAYSGFAAA